MSVQVSQIYSKLDQIHNLPTIPEIMFEAIKIIKSEPGNVIKLSKIIGKDQGMVAKILSVANSPLYGMRRNVTSLEFAIMLMGAKELENVITAISLSNAIQFKSSSTFNEKKYWHHSMAVGLVSKDISRKLENSEIAGDAFIGGILHDIGIQLFAKYFSKEFQLITESNKDYFRSELEVFGLTHQDAGAYLLNKWNLPISLIQCVEYHHSPEYSNNNRTLVSIINLADYIVNNFSSAKAMWDYGINLNYSISDTLGFVEREDLDKFIREYAEEVTNVISQIDR